MTLTASNMLNTVLTVAENIIFEDSSLNIEGEKWYKTFVEGLYVSNKGRAAGFYQYLNHSCYRILNPVINTRCTIGSSSIKYAYVAYNLPKLIYATFNNIDYFEIFSKQQYKIELKNNNIEYPLSIDNIILIDVHKNDSYVRNSRYYNRCLGKIMKNSNDNDTKIDFESLEFKEAVMKVVREMFNH